MKFRNVYVTCKRNRNAISALEGKTTAGKNTIRIMGWNAAKTSLEELKNVACLRAPVEKILHDIVILSYRDSIEMSKRDWDNLSKARNEILRTLDISYPFASRWA